MSNKLIKNNVNKDNTSKHRLKLNLSRIAGIIYMIFVPIGMFYLQEFMLRNPFEKIKPPIQILNILFWELLLFALFSILGRLRTAILLEGILAAIVGIVDHYVISFRGAPVQPWDFGSILVATSVASEYDYTPNASMIYCTLGIAVLCGVGFLTHIELPRYRLKGVAIKRIVLSIIAITLLVGYGRYAGSDRAVKRYRIYDKLFTPLTMTYKDGTAVAFLMEMKYMNVEKPAGYSDRKADDLLSQYETAPISDDQKKTPNIIVIMNEAFSDLSVLGEYSTNMDEMPFVRSLLNGSDNTVSGYLDVSVVGGNTANTEFEFLTGDSMAWLPQGSVPYQQYINRPTESMASVLKSQGYNTVAIHPYKPKGWCRNTVYDYFGFDEFISINDFKDPEILRDYISDAEDYRKIIDVYETKKGSPLFIFNVTMQNHSSYTDEYENFTPEIKVDGVESVATNQYLSLIHRSDEALEELVGYFDKVDEPTIIVFFGDHQPTDSVVSPIYKLNGRSVYDLSEEDARMRYKVPFIVWSNVALFESQSNTVTSANFLGARVMELAGVQTSAYQNYLCELSERYNSVSVMQATDVAGNVATVSSAKQELADYRILQYYHLFNK